ncbi:MAG: energy-coupling factor transporter transmembrane protein EcfT [Cyanobacteria bacterium REEB459]|nr:energy-coupling factor transporter transmembrane protein EcfT [Cyanobacteria bacterium REEB459]
MDLLRSLPLGLYLEQPTTWLHRLDPRVKIAWLMGFLLTPILANPSWRFGLVGALLLVTLATGIPLRVWRQQLGWLLLLSSLVMVLTWLLPDGLEVSQPVRLPPAEALTPLSQPTGYRYQLFHWGWLTITQRSLELGIRIGTLLFTLIYGTNLYLLTTAPEEITLALESLISPLGRLRLPVTEITLTVTLSLRFIPLVLEEVQNLVRSVQTRAINWKKLGFRSSIQVWLVVIERLLENLLLRAEQIAAAMAVRGFTSPDQHQVRWHQLVLQGRDWLALGALVLFCWLRLGWGGEG